MVWMKSAEGFRSAKILTPTIRTTLHHKVLHRVVQKPSIFKEPKPVAEKKPQARQEMMQFEPVTRGRFEKSEPTIVEGQDLDVPTFLRKNVRVK